MPGVTACHRHHREGIGNPADSGFRSPVALRARLAAGVRFATPRAYAHPAVGFAHATASSLGRCPSAKSPGSEARKGNGGTAAEKALSIGDQLPMRGARGWRGVPPPPMEAGPLLTTTARLARITLMSCDQGVALPAGASKGKPQACWN